MAATLKVHATKHGWRQNEMTDEKGTGELIYQKWGIRVTLYIWNNSQNLKVYKHSWHLIYFSLLFTSIYHQNYVYTPKYYDNNFVFDINKYIYNIFLEKLIVALFFLFFFLNYIRA